MSRPTVTIHSNDVYTVKNNTNPYLPNMIMPSFRVSDQFKALFGEKESEKAADKMRELLDYLSYEMEADIHFSEDIPENAIEQIPEDMKTIADIQLGANNDNQRQQPEG